MTKREKNATINSKTNGGILMEILMLEPALSPKLWGGTKLIDEYGFRKPEKEDAIGEAWLLSAHEDGLSTVAEGTYKGKTLPEVIEICGREILGTKNAGRDGFPILIKLIDACDKLSIQVHPGDEYAWEHENENGKTEAWYIVEAQPGAQLIYGVNREMTREEFAADIKNGTLLRDVNSVEVHPGDVVFIPSGMLHAIGTGILLAEVQQSSNTTYRVYDYDRIDKDGKKRELHIEKATDVVTLTAPEVDFRPAGEPVVTGGAVKTFLTGCEFFSMTRVAVNGSYVDAAEAESFVSLLVLDGTGTVSADGKTYELKKGSSVFIPAGTKNYRVEGCGLELIEART